VERRRRNNELSMMTFRSPQPNCARHVCKQANADTFNFTPQIASSICAVAFTKPVKPDAAIFGSRCSRTVIGYRLDRVEALPLVKTRFLRLANSSPKTARSSARRSRDGREMSGKKSCEISRVIYAQSPSNGRATATAMPPDGRPDDSQDNLPCAGLWPRRKLARQLAICLRNSRAAAHATAKATSRKQLVEIPSPTFNHDIQKL
jgi:hypothetical protein